MNLFTKQKQTQRLRKQRYGMGKCQGGINYIHTLLHYQIINKDLLYSAENSTQYSAMTYMRASLMVQWTRICLPGQGTQV